MYLEEEDSPRIVEVVDDSMDLNPDVEGPTDCHNCARTSGSVLYGLPLYQKGNVNKATW